MQIPILDYTLADIMLFFQNDWILAWVIILSGGLLAIWLLENITDPIPLLGSIFDLLVHVGTYVGFFVGIIDIFVGYVIWTVQPDAAIVAGVLVLMGFTLVMRILAKFPLAIVFAAGLAVFGAATMYGALAPLVGTTWYSAVPEIAQAVDFLISGKGLIIVGAIIFAIVYVISDLVFKIIALIAKIFASTPVSLIIGLAAIAIGVIVIINPALVGLVAWPIP